MRTLYFDCSMGAAGDMLSAALYELIEDKEAYVKKINSIGLKGVNVNPSEMIKCGIAGTHMHVLVDGVSEGEEHEHHEHSHEHHHEHDEHHEHHHDHDHHHEEHEHEHYSHHHSSMKDIEDIIDSLDIPDNVKKDVKSVYALIAEAESNAHKVPVRDIHFHEVGTMDAIADIVGVCLLINELSPEKIVASNINVGGGHVHCAHGILPVPAPATVYILRDIPIYSGHIQSELCTPTGAALLKHFVTSFGEMPVMKVEKIGYGMGKKDFEQANCVRAFIGETSGGNGEIAELSFNVDDMTAERIAFATERFYEGGAREVFTVPVGMKKSRPGTLICVICDKEKEEKMVELIFMHTTTLGLRENVCKRYTLERTIIKKDTEFGEVRIKKSAGYGVEREKYEYEDLARIAKDKNMSIDEVIKLL